MILHTGKVFSRLNFNIPDEILESAANSKPGVVEFILSTLRIKVSIINDTEKWVHNNIIVCMCVD